MAKKDNTREAADMDAGLITVILAMPHKHDGKQLIKGDPLKVTPIRADWLLRHGIIEPLQPDIPQSGE